MDSSIHLKNRRAAPALAALIVLLTTPALAKDAAEMRAREQFRAGQAAYANGRYEQALGAFSEAYGLQPVPGFLFNIAQCHRQLGNYERAAVFYQQYLELSPSSANTARVRALLGEIEASEKERKHRLAEQQQKLRAVVDSTRAGPSPLQSALAPNHRDAKITQPAPSGDSIFTKWWFWTGMGAIALGTTTYILASHLADPTPSAIHSR
jgi:tetratricopeptide (TPR) repeat protein